MSPFCFGSLCIGGQLPLNVKEILNIFCTVETSIHWDVKSISLTYFSLTVFIRDGLILLTEALSADVDLTEEALAPEAVGVVVSRYLRGRQPDTRSDAARARVARVHLICARLSCNIRIQMKPFWVSI